MFNFLKKKQNPNVIITFNENIDKDKDNDKETSLQSGMITTVTESAKVSTEEAAKIFQKPSKYDRSVIDDGMAKKNIKVEAFNSGIEVRDPYTGDILTLTRAEAMEKYGDDWTNHLAEADHKISLAQRYEDTKNKPWLSNDNIKASSNSSDNLEVVSRSYNNAKRSRSNEDFVTDDEYLEKTGVELTEEGKLKAIQSEKIAKKALQKQDFKDSVGNILNTGHSAGKNAAINAGVTGVTMSGILNLTAVIKGEKSAEDAIADTVVDSGKRAVTGYCMGGGLTTVSHTLSGSSSGFLKALSKYNVPGNVITAVMITGDTLKRYGDGEITTQECLIELGGKGLNFATTGYSMAVGQAMIPIPIVGAAVGALVGSTITSNYYNQLMITLQNKELEHQERLRIIAECEKASSEARAFRKELEAYLSEYFSEYRTCFDEALSMINSSFEIGDAEGIITGANQITRKLGGKVNYDNMDEFKNFLFDDTTDIL